MATKKTIYLDYNATTPCDPRVVEAMRPYFSERFGNSMSVTSPFGWDAEEALEASRRKIANALKVRSHEITFTSGATEANNWAIRGLVENIRVTEGPTAKIHILSTPVEHASVLKTLEHVKAVFNVEIDWIAINAFGQMDVQDLKKKLRPETRLVCAIWVNNEIGSVNPMAEIADICRANGTLVMADATQAIGKVPVDLTAVPVDLLSFSAHKLYGPKGAGFLFHRAQNPRVELQPLFCGGGHERGQRSGTVNVPGIVGMATALEIGLEVLVEESARLQTLRDRMWRELQSVFPGLRLNGAPFQERSPVNLNITFPAYTKAVHLPGLAVSQSSACSSGKSATSHVLRALGLSDEAARATIRITLGRQTTLEDIDQAIDIISKNINTPQSEMALR